MDRNAFDGLTKLLAASPSRRKALGALLGAGLAGTLGAAEAKKDRKQRKAGRKTKDGADVAAQAADCSSPGPSTNISGCPFQDADFSGQDLSGSRMVATNFRRAELVGTDLSSSNARNAIFREADLTCADLRSSTLGGADFRAADLTGANLKSSGGCNSAMFNNATTFCGTVMCDGSVRNDDCAGGPDVCCPACGPGEQCVDGECAPTFCSTRGVSACRPGPACGDGCACQNGLDGVGVCVTDFIPCSGCTGDEECEPAFGPGARCLQAPGCCGGNTACAAACPNPL